jgi:16S rRNA (uracil1498-N3)-methyltransferase
VIVGPEGGLTDDEVAQFEQASAASVSLGPRILRTETAALVTVAQILFAREPA